MPTTPPGASDLSAAWELVVRRFPLAKRLDYSVPLKTQMVLKAKNVFSAGRIEFDAGATDNGAPGVREIYHPNYYGAYVRDPDNNKLQAVCHSANR